MIRCCINLFSFELSKQKLSQKKLLDIFFVSQIKDKFSINKSSHVHKKAKEHFVLEWPSKKKGFELISNSIKDSNYIMKKNIILFFKNKINSVVFWKKKILVKFLCLYSLMVRTLLFRSGDRSSILLRGKLIY